MIVCWYAVAYSRAPYLPIMVRHTQVSFIHLGDESQNWVTIWGHHAIATWQEIKSSSKLRICKNIWLKYTKRGEYEPMKAATNDGFRKMPKCNDFPNKRNQERSMFSTHTKNNITWVLQEFYTSRVTLRHNDIDGICKFRYDCIGHSCSDQNIVRFMLQAQFM